MSFCHRNSLLVVCVLAAIVAALAWRHYMAVESVDAAMGAGPLSESSLYQLESPWRTDGHQAFRLRELRGSYQVLVMIFTECTGTCPMLVKQLQSLQTTLPVPLVARTRFTAVSIDPDRDTPEVLQRYRQRMRLGDSTWILLTGDANGVRELAAVLGFNYEAAPLGQFVHSGIVTVLNPDGEIIHQQSGGADLHGVIRAINAAEGA